MFLLCSIPASIESVGLRHGRRGGSGALGTIETAMEHVHRIEGYALEQELYRVVFCDETLQIGARPAAEEPRRYPSQSSIDSFLIALRDGYVRATGRRSTIRRNDCEDDRNVWRLHVVDPTLITTDEWRAGEFDSNELMLTGPSWQYIHIQVPEFMVKAIWPDWPEGDDEPAIFHLDAPDYTTPYLELMQQAILQFGLTVLHQEKKEVLSDWFRTQRIDGEPVSKNLADAMATLVRLPSAQRGGAKRMRGPDLRQRE